tara:strand:- start:436 stop:618 length:183 start_codon:yes stop_codon:yes gene_type:complete
MSVEEIVKNLKDGNNVKATKAFNGVMADKLSAALDAEKIKVGSTLIQRKAEESDENEINN